MSNFTFLFTDKTWRDIYRAAQKAERYVRSDARTALFHGRRTIEVLVEWLYTYDKAYHRPYDNNLGSLMHGNSFKQYVPYTVQKKMDALRKMGNIAVHDARPIKQSAGMKMVQELFHVAYWFARTYTNGDPNQVPSQFDEEKVPASLATLQVQSRQQLKELDAKLQEQDETLRQKQETIAALQAEIEALQAQITTRKVVNEAIPDTHDYSEAQTRQLLIDVYLREAGWDVEAEHVREYKVSPMPNPKGFGYADYVLWGRDGKPLAVVEAKRVNVDADAGKRQAELYADALEQMHGQRPIIFYTNGYDIWLWDDAGGYPPRPVQGFYTQDELQRLIQRRTLARSLKEVKIDRAIVDRPYQEEAIRRVTEHWTARHRHALVVMATGTGKTRTTIALVDVLMRANWIKRVLFLADRTALVRQAVRAFKAHLPASNPINLLEDKEAKESRVVVSTYHTILNQIDESRDNGQKLFGVGHFDLIIIDEAHRSVYQKFGMIFEYFDSLLLGLTATPKDEVDRNTYELFQLETGVPTYAYDLDEAIGDGYLVPPIPMDAGTQFLREGISYNQLSEEEKAEWDLLDWGDSEEIPDSVEASDLNQKLFNHDTIDQVLKALMTHGLKVAGGDRLGKTIIFAKNHNHAQLIVKRFDVHYPQYAGKFAQLIDNTVKYAHTSIDNFSTPHKMPHIAVSVDMLDTGIDVPPVVNLVFFKIVRSKTKFFQMIGRGTRLCPDLFAPSEDKENFLIFDCCGNFEFFRYHPAGKTSGHITKPLNQRLFEARLTLLETLQQHNDPMLTPLLNQTADALHDYVAHMNLNNFIVRPHRQYVETFQNRTRWDSLKASDIHTLLYEVASLPSEAPDELESTKRLDLLLVQLQLSLLTGEDIKSFQTSLVNIVHQFNDPTTQNIPEVKAHLPLIKHLQTEEYWQGVTLPQLEDVRRALRELTRFLKPQKRKEPLVSNFADTFGELKPTDLPYISQGVNKAQYKKKVEQFIREHEDYVVIHKIRWGMALTNEDLDALHDFFYQAEAIGSEADFTYAFGKQDSLAHFIRGLVGLDRKAAKEKFAGFLDGNTYNSTQIQFVNYIIDHLTSNGTMSPSLLYEHPFTDIHYEGLEGVFSGEQADKLVKLIKAVNHITTSHFKHSPS